MSDEENTTTSIVLLGNLSEGFRAVGPFPDHDAAASHTLDGWIMALKSAGDGKDGKSIQLSPYNQGPYTKRGNIHDLEYYDGPLISAQMCRAKEDVPVIEVAIDSRAAETDGFTVYTRFSKEDLQTMLRMLEDPVIEVPVHCPAYLGTATRCLTCDPLPVETVEPGFWIVVDEESTPRRRLAAHATQASAEAWIGHQPDKAKVERGGYGIDGPCTDVDLVPMPDGTEEENTSLVPGDPGVHCVLVEGADADDCRAHPHEFVGVATAAHVPDLDYCNAAKDGVFDFTCRKCRVLGSIKVTNDDINWDDDGKGCT